MTDRGRLARRIGAVLGRLAVLGAALLVAAIGIGAVTVIIAAV